MTKVYLPEGAGPCVKASVVATLITKDGERFESSNFCRTPQQTCARTEQGYAPGQGYHLCREVCNQTGHAEVNVINFARLMSPAFWKAPEGATMYVDYCDPTGKVQPWICAPCAELCESSSIRHVLGKPPEESSHTQKQWDKYQTSRAIVLGEK
jgi:hypothetical protein